MWVVFSPSLTGAVLEGWLAGGRSEGPGPPLAPLTTRDGMALAQSPSEAKAAALPGPVLAWAWGSKPPWAARPAGHWGPASPSRRDVSRSGLVHPQLASPSEKGPNSAGPNLCVPVRGHLLTVSPCYVTLGPRKERLSENTVLGPQGWRGGGRGHCHLLVTSRAGSRARPPSPSGLLPPQRDACFLSAWRFFVVRMLSHRTSFDCYCDLVKHTGQVFFLLRDEEINYSKAVHHHSWEKPRVGHGPSSRFVLAVLEDLSHVCVSEVVRPRAVAEPGRPGVRALAPGQVWEAGCRMTRFLPIAHPKGRIRRGLWFLDSTAVLSRPHSCPFPFC